MKVINNKNGFTLIELLVVVAIIGILASVGVVSFQGYTKMAKNRVLVANWKTISKVIELELAAANNGLDSFIAEYDEDGNDTLSINGDVLIEDDKKLFLGSGKEDKSLSGVDL